MNKMCPFCASILPKHKGCCFHGGIPPGHEIENHEEKKRVNDIKKLMDNLTNPNKVIIDGGGGDLKKRYGGK